MNKKRRRLTLAALAVFGLIIFFHYCDPWFHQGQLRFGEGGAWHGGRYHAGSIEPLIADVRMPLFALAVVYAGLFFLFGGKDAAPAPRRPRDWRRIKRVISIISVIAAGLAVIAGLSAGIILGHQYDARQERLRKANIEYEASKHRIKPYEIGVQDLKLDGVPYGPVGEYNVTGRVTNGSNYNLTALVLTITLTDNYPDKSLEVIGQERVTFNVTIPPHQTRDIQHYVRFQNLPKPKAQYVFNTFIAETRGTKSDDWFEANAPSGKNFDPDKYLGLTPTPSPKP